MTKYLITQVVLSIRRALSEPSMALGNQLNHILFGSGSKSNRYPWATRDLKKTGKSSRGISGIVTLFPVLQSSVQIGSEMEATGIFCSRFRLITLIWLQRDIRVEKEQAVKSFGQLLSELKFLCESNWARNLRELKLFLKLIIFYRVKIHGQNWRLLTLSFAKLLDQYLVCNILNLLDRELIELPPIFFESSKNPVS